MGIENVIRLIQRRITPMDSEHKDINITRTFHRDDYKSLDVVIESFKRGEENGKLLNKIKFIAGFNITIESERKEVISMVEESVKELPITRCLIKIGKERK